jgi:hypothetical protein
MYLFAHIASQTSGGSLKMCAAARAADHGVAGNQYQTHFLWTKGKKAHHEKSFLN